MKFIKFAATIIFVLTGLFLSVACDSGEVEKTLETETTRLNETEPTGYAAEENFDLRRIGDLVREADDAAELEYLINRDDGINNLDLNEDGYADYISVAEYEDEEDEGIRGLSLFTRFGLDQIQEIATIIFDRDRPDRPGARVYLLGNERIYGDDYTYEGDWLDKSLDIARWIFSDRDEDYRSPYYYDRYPDDYTEYRVVETPVYQSRVRRLYPEPVFVKTQVNPALTKVKIRSPYHGKIFIKTHNKKDGSKGTQKEFAGNDPNRPAAAKNKRYQNEKPEKKPKDSARSGKERPAKIDRPDRGKTEKPATPRDRGNGADKKRSGKPDKKNDSKNVGRSHGPEKSKGKGGGRP